MAAAACVAVYVTWASYYSIMRYAQYEATAFDLGIYLQGVWLISHGYYPFFDTVRGLPLFGDHATLILILVAPLYRLYPRPEFLLFIQSVALGSGGLATYGIAFWRLRNQGLALVLTIAYLLYAPVQWMNSWDFHPDVFATPFLLFAILALYRQRWVWFWITLVCALASKETVGLVVAAFGLYVGAVAGWRRGSGVVLLGLAWTYFTLNLIQYFDGGAPSPYIVALYGQYGRNLPSILGFILTHPITTIHLLLNKQNVLYLGELLYPIAFLPFAAPELILITIPALGINLLSRSPLTHFIQYQYTASIVPFMMVGAIHGFGQCLEWCHSAPIKIRYLEWMLGAILLLCSIYGCWTIGPWFSGKKTHGVAMSRRDRKELRRIPASACVSAQTALVPILSQRRYIYAFPNPFLHKAWGSSINVFLHQEGAHAHLTSDQLALRFARSKVDYIVLDPGSFLWPLVDSSQYRYVLRQLFRSRFYGIIYAKNGLIVLRRGANHQQGLELLRRMRRNDRLGF